MKLHDFAGYVIIIIIIIIIVITSFEALPLRCRRLVAAMLLKVMNIMAIDRFE